MSDIVERLRTPVYCEDLMCRWDRWRKQHKDGFAGSATRDEFESIIDGIDEERAEAAAEIERLNHVAGLVFDDATAVARQRNDATARADAAEARLAEAVEVMRWYAGDGSTYDGIDVGQRARAFLAKVDGR